MNATELLQNAQFVFDTDGNKIAVQLDYAVWEELLTMLEDIEYAEEIICSRASGEEPIALEQTKAELQADDMLLRPFGLCAGEFEVPDNFDHPLPESVHNEFEGKI